MYRVSGRDGAWSLSQKVQTHPMMDAIQGNQRQKFIKIQSGDLEKVQKYYGFSSLLSV
jgi:hypothetical protein